MHTGGKKPCFHTPHTKITLLYDLSVVRIRDYMNRAYAFAGAASNAKRFTRQDQTVFCPMETTGGADFAVFAAMDAVLKIGNSVPVNDPA